MEIQYQRNLKNSYLVVIEKNQPLNMDGALAEKMLARQEIQGLLQWVSMEHEGDMTFWYRITGRQSLSDWLEQHTLDARLLGSLLSVLLALQEELPRHYLKPEHLLLREEQIFLQPSGNGVQLCYEPLWVRQPQEALAELLEQLLPKLDHEDEQAVALGYGLYELCQKPNADVWGFVLAQMQVTRARMSVPEQPTVQAVLSDREETAMLELETESEESLQARRHFPLMQEKKSRKEKMQKKINNKEISSEKISSKEINNGEIGNNGIQNKELQNIEIQNREIQHKQRKTKETKKETKKEKTVLFWNRLHRNETQEQQKRPFSFELPHFSKREKQPQAAPLYVFEPEEEAVVSEHPTVYLGGGAQTEGRLDYVGSGAERSFVIEGAALVIGSAHGQADGCLQASGVSRSHARITKEESFYYIEDLNSRNGTYLNGELLPYKQKRRLQSGDRLRFAREEYVFH